MSTARSSTSTGPGISSSEWYCHCCSARNHQKQNQCRICGRPVTYADGPHLPLHDIGRYVLRPNQVSTVLPLDHLHDTNEMRWTALHSCASVGNHALVHELLRQGSEINATTVEGYTPLHLAVFSGSLETVALITSDKTCNINAQTFFESNTALHISVQEGWRSICQYLIGTGINTTLVNALGRTPLHLAAVTGRTDIGYYFLEQKLFSVFTKDAMGWSLQQIAEFYQHRDFEEMCLQFSLPDNQYKIREIPPREWDSDLWKEIVKIKQLADEKRIKEERVYSVREEDGRGGGGWSSARRIEQPFLSLSESSTERSSNQQRRLIGEPPLAAGGGGGGPRVPGMGRIGMLDRNASDTILSPLSVSTSRSQQLSSQAGAGSGGVAHKPIGTQSKYALAAQRNLSFKS
jgi:hypothetical protein